MEPPRDDQLIADLRALRPAPRPEFAAELDQRAAAGFPRRSRLPRPSFARLQTLPRRRLLLPAMGVALAAIAVATVLVATGQSGQSGLGTREEEGGFLSLVTPTGEPAPQAAKPHSPPPAVRGSNATEEGGVEFESEVPEVPSASSGASRASAGAASGSVEASNDSFNASFRHRDVERAAEVVLAAEADDVAGDAAKVFEAVHANDGVVMRSSTHEGKAGEAGAAFELLIPSAKLPDALAAFSTIDEVRSRHEATADITHPTVTTAELLQESRARIDGLLGQLGEAETESEREALEAELRHERRHASRLAAQLDNLHKRADYSRVSLRIVTGEAEESSGGGWSIGDAFHDARHILAIATAVTVVTTAILGPLVLIALLIWLAYRARVRRQRRRVLR